MISLAAPDDISALAKLLEALFLIEDDFAIDAQRQNEGLKRLLENPNSFIFVAKLEDKVVGMITLQIVISTAVGAHVGIIEDLVVALEHRGKGIGAALLEALISQASQQNLQRLTLGVDIRNSNAISFYQKFGFSKSHMGLMYRHQS